MIGLGLLGVYVTFVDELASLNEACVSMVATVVPDNPAERTYELSGNPPTAWPTRRRSREVRPDLPAAEGAAGVMKAFLMYPDRDFTSGRTCRRTRPTWPATWS